MAIWSTVERSHWSTSYNKMLHCGCFSHFTNVVFFFIMFQVTLKGVSGITDKSSKWTRLDLLICSCFLFVMLSNLYVNR